MPNTQIFDRRKIIGKHYVMAYITGINNRPKVLCHGVGKLCRHIDTLLAVRMANIVSSVSAEVADGKEIN